MRCWVGYFPLSLFRYFLENAPVNIREEYKDVIKMALEIENIKKVIENNINDIPPNILSNINKEIRNIENKIEDLRAPMAP